MIETALYFAVALILLVLQYVYGGGRRWSTKAWWGWVTISVTWPIYLVAVPVVFYLWFKQK